MCGESEEQRTKGWMLFVSHRSRKGSTCGPLVCSDRSWAGNAIFPPCVLFYFCPSPSSFSSIPVNMTFSLRKPTLHARAYMPWPTMRATRE
eukprot:8381337-Pyramimonas_sp.AAC.1